MNGILISGNADYNVIGDFAANVGTGSGNIIAYNGNDGVLNNSTGLNSILSNSIFANGNVAIHVGPNDGSTPNITGGFENYPLISPPIVDTTNTTILQVTLNSTAGTSFVIQIFAVSVPQAGTAITGTCVYITSETVTTDASGNYDGQLSFEYNRNAYQFYTGTATSTSPTNSLANNTSQFSVPATRSWLYRELAGRCPLLPNLFHG